MLNVTLTWSGLLFCLLCSFVLCEGYIDIKRLFNYLARKVHRIRETRR